MFSLLIFYQMLNKRSKQHSLLHFLIGKFDQTHFPHPSTVIWFIGHVMWKSTWKNNLQCWKFNLLVKCKREYALIVSMFSCCLKEFLPLIFSDLSYKKYKSINSKKKKNCPIRNIPEGQYNKGIIKWSSAIFFPADIYFLILLHFKRQNLVYGCRISIFFGLLRNLLMAFNVFLILQQS